MKLRPVKAVVAEVAGERRRYVIRLSDSAAVNVEAVLRADRRATIEAAKEIIRGCVSPDKDPQHLGCWHSLPRDVIAALDALLDEAEATEEHDA